MFLPSNITLKFGDSGDFVAELQRRLAMALGSSGDVTGFYDGSTVNAVTQFQGMHGLHADGVAGPETLRRLNGVIAGDSSGGNPTEEEEKKKAANAATAMANFYHLGQEQLQAEQAMLATGHAAPSAEVAPSVGPTSATPPAPDVPVPHTAASTAPAMDPVAAMIAQAQQADAAQLQPRQAAAAVSAPAQDLMQMLMHAAPAAAVAVATTPSPPPMTEPPQPAVAARVAELPPVAATEAVTAQAPAGLMEKAIRFSSGAMQKLAEYIESKLPTSVLREVQQAGQVMAQAGMKESAIPTGPEMARAPEQLPQRAPEPQPQQTR